MVEFISESLRPMLGTIFEACLAEQIINTLGTAGALVYAEKEYPKLQAEIRKEVARIRSHRAFMGHDPDTQPEPAE